MILFQSVNIAGQWRLYHEPGNGAVEAILNSQPIENADDDYHLTYAEICICREGK